MTGVMVNSLWHKTRLLPRNSVLAVARAAGRATRVTQDSTLAMVKGAVRVATWANERVACSARCLNPFIRCKDSAQQCESQEGQPARTALVQEPRLSNSTSAAVCDVPGPKAPTTDLGAGPVAASDLQEVGVSTAERSAKPRSRRKHDGKKARGQRRRWFGGGVVPPEVTPEEASAAVFAGVAEKVMFGRALKSLASPCEAVRARAARLLGGISHGLSIKELAARVARDPSAEVRRECVNGLTALGMKEGLPAVERALSDRCGSVRLAAVRGVHRLAGPAGAAALIRMFADDHEDVRRRAAACLGWLGLAPLAVELVPLLGDSSASVRRATLDALGNLRSFAAMDKVIELLDDPEETVQREAFEVLATITGKRMAETFPEDENGRRVLIARWRVWWERNPLRQKG